MFAYNYITSKTRIGDVWTDSMVRANLKCFLFFLIYSVFGVILHHLLCVFLLCVCVFFFFFFFFFFNLGQVHIHGLISTHQMHVTKIELIFIITTDCIDCGLFVFIKGVKCAQGFCNHLKMHVYPELLSYKYTHINMS